jgi:hypothetical protein
VIELRERILQLAGHEEEVCSSLWYLAKSSSCLLFCCSFFDTGWQCQEKSRIELLDDLNMCKRDTLIEICRSFDIAGSRANRKVDPAKYFTFLLSCHLQVDDTERYIFSLFRRNWYHF